MKEFYSPFHLVNNWFPDFEQISFDALKLKKRILAEFELTDGYPIKIGNQEINKSDALNIVSRLKEQEFYDSHYWIFKQKGLLNFLENGDPNFFQEAVPTTLPEGAVQLISETFASKYSKLLTRMILKGTVETVRKICRFPLESFTLPSDRFKAHDQVQRMLLGITEEVQAVANRSSGSIERGPNFRQKTQKIALYTKEDFIKKINLLPQDFLLIRMHLANAFISIAVRYNNDFKNYKKALQFITAARRIKGGEELKAETARLYQLIKGNTKEHGGSGWGNYWYLAVIVIGIFRLARGCDSGRSEYSAPPIYEYNRTSPYNHELTPFPERVELEDSIIYLDEVIIDTTGF
jgi:hypothetical protein